MVDAKKYLKIYKDADKTEFQYFTVIWNQDDGTEMSIEKKNILKKYFVDTDEPVETGGRRRSSSRKNYKKSVRRVKTAKRSRSVKSRKYRNRK